MSPLTILARMLHWLSARGPRLRGRSPPRGILEFETPEKAIMKAGRSVMRTLYEEAAPRGRWDRVSEDVPGIVIADGGLGSRVNLRGSRVRAFIYGEESVPTPTLPFGRWKEAS